MLVESGIRAKMSVAPHGTVGEGQTGGCGVGGAQMTGRGGGMADAKVSKTFEGNLVRVRLPPSAPALQV